MTDLDAVEDYAARLQTGSPRAGDLVNVPTALLDASWVSSLFLGADTVLVGTVQSVGYDGVCSSVLVKALVSVEFRRAPAGERRPAPPFPQEGGLARHPPLPRPPASSSPTSPFPHT